MGKVEYGNRFRQAGRGREGIFFYHVDYVRDDARGRDQAVVLEYVAGGLAEVVEGRGEPGEVLVVWLIAGRSVVCHCCVLVGLEVGIL